MIRFFLKDVESGEGFMHCGDASDIPGAMKSIGYMLENTLEELKRDGATDQTFILSAKDMTDEEVEALPDL